MSRPFSPASSRNAGHRRSLRWLAVLLASLLLHLIAFNWASGRIGMPSWHDREPPVMLTELLPPPAKKVIVPPHPKTPPRPKARPKPAAPPPPPSPPIEEPAPTVAEIPKPVVAAPAVPASTAAPAAADAPATVADAPAAPQAPEPQYKFSPPPSVELQYDVIALRDSQKWYGSGKFQWTSTGDSYRVTGEASITFLFKITVLNFSSEGTIDSFGVAPVLYSEKPFRKSMTNTHFQHDNHKITFSASTASYPYNGGEQDRASIMLASIGRGDPTQFAPGAQINVFVAGTRDAENWVMRVIGDEEVDTGYGKMPAWHLVRVPRAGSYDQKIDIWLSPQHEWYPVKILYTYPNGDYLDMSLSDLAPGANH